MRVSYNWLKDYLDIDISPEDMAEKMTKAGLEIDEVEHLGAEVSKVVVARVLSCEKVEKSDHLHVCRVTNGTEELTVICGAPNVREGLTVALACEGAVLPGGFTIGRRKTFGVESQGMLCSESELGIGDDHSGIWELPDDLPLGEDALTAMNRRDHVFILDLTPNRSDCLGIVNVAREMAALTGAAVQEPQINYLERGDNIRELIDITVEDPQLVPRYLVRLVRGVKIGPSPVWMQNYLIAAGMRPINNVVDISNFVMLEQNQPLHTFDYQRLKDKKIIVREAHPGEKMTTLDGKEREFAGDEILICDGAGPVCIAGVMGGLESEVTDATTDILIESACFDQVRIRHASRRHAIPSEASMRFEKGVDPANCDVAAKRAVQLLVEYCGGIADKGACDICSLDFSQKRVPLRRSRVNYLLGTNYTLNDITQVIEALHFPYERSGVDEILVFVPSYRRDISLEVDLIEEVARLRGFEEIPVSLPLNASAGALSYDQKLLRRLKHKCAGLGLYEVVNYSFISPKEADRLLLPDNHPWRNTLAISNPLNEDQSVMRQSLIPGILHTAARNLSRRNLDLRMFEVGRVFIPDAHDAVNNQPEEPLHLAMLMAGASAPGWLHKSAAYDYFDLKGIVEELLHNFGIDDAVFVRGEAPYLHPGRTAEIYIQDKFFGLIGELHPQAAANYEIEDRAVIAELELSVLFEYADIIPRKHSLPRYPAVNRDIAVIGSVDIAASEIEKIIYEEGGEFLVKAELFDIYTGTPIPEGQRSMAYSLTFVNEQCTLTDKEIDEAFAHIVSALDERLGVKLR